MGDRKKDIKDPFLSAVGAGARARLGTPEENQGPGMFSQLMGMLQPSSAAPAPDAPPPIDPYRNLVDPEYRRKQGR